jgi:hypothetical protein
MQFWPPEPPKLITFWVLSTMAPWESVFPLKVIQGRALAGPRHQTWPMPWLGSPWHSTQVGSPPPCPTSFHCTFSMVPVLKTFPGQRSCTSMM